MAGGKYGSLVPHLRNAKLAGLERLAKSMGILPKRAKKQRESTYRDKVVSALRIALEREERESAQGHFPILREGHVGPAVLELQWLMRTRPTGVMSSMDAIEVQALQQHWGLPVTGIVDEAFWRRMRAAGWNPLIKLSPWFLCKQCGIPVPDKRDMCMACEVIREEEFKK